MLGVLNRASLLHRSYSKMIFISLLCTFWVFSPISLTEASWSTVIQDEYPPGSLACKLYNESVLDCSHRGLSVIPSTDKQNATYVDLTNNRIKVIPPTAFSGQIQLKSIDFTMNQLLSITGSPFADLSSLVYLNLSNSLLSYLASTSFTGLHMLEMLNISFNSLNTLPYDVFRELHSLKILDLAFNQFTTVPSSALPPLRNLTKLFLDLNPIKSVMFGPEFELLNRLESFGLTSMDYELPPLTNNTFQHFSRNPLRILFFHWNPFTDAEVGIFETLENIEFLSTGPFGFTEKLFSISSRVETLQLLITLFSTHSILTKDFFTPLSNLNESLTKLVLTFTSPAPDIKIEGFAFKWFSSLRQLELSRYENDRIELANDTLYGLNKLEDLSLRRIMLTAIPSVAFKALALSGSLRRLDLSGNGLTGHFPPDAFASVTSMEHLDLSYNPISTISKWIEILTNLTCLLLNGGNTLFFTVTQWTVPVYSLIEMRLDGLLNEGLPGEGELILSRKAPNLEILNVADTETIYRLSTIRNLTSLQFLDVSGSLTKLAEDNLFKQWSSIFFPNLTNLKFARNVLKTMTELNLYITTPGVVDVDLSMNMITVVDKNIALLLHLQHLNLNDNQISSLDNLHNLVHMKSLKLARNLINFVSATFVKGLRESELEVLDMSSNPFECTCAIRPFKNWILGDKRVYLEPSLYRCGSPETYYDISLTQVKLDCRSYFGMHVAIATCCSILAALITILAWRHRWYLRYRFFLLLNWHRMRYEDIDREDNNFEMVELPYDAFVSYAHQSDNDLEWVLDEMRPNLEELGPEPIRLCIGQARDFTPGTNLFDSITDAIHRSHKTIVVLSPNYMDSELCYFEIQQAWNRLLEESRDVLILILLEPIPDDKMTVWMRQLLCKKSYLRWPQNRAEQQLFWRCVREKMKKRTLVNRRFDRGFDA